MNGVEEFFAFARERYQILLKRRDGRPWPWTKDRVLQSFYFTNIFREDDRTTVWFREHVRDPLRDHPRVLLATVAFRWFNRIETGEVIEDLLFEGWDSEEAFKRLMGRSPVVTGAYVIKTPNGMSKLRGVLQCIDVFAHEAEAGRFQMGNNLQDTHLRLMQIPYLGGFMAYELVTDLRHTMLLRRAKDVHTWAHFGPGASRGICRVLGWELNTLKHNSRRDQTRMLTEGQRLLHHSTCGDFWPKQYPLWEMREVEHTLCEFDKYKRAQSGEGRMKRTYTPKGPALRAI